MTSVVSEMGFFSLVLGEQCEFLVRGKMQQIQLEIFLIFWIQLCVENMNQLLECAFLTEGSQITF